MCDTEFAIWKQCLCCCAVCHSCYGGRWHRGSWQANISESVLWHKPKRLSSWKLHGGGAPKREMRWQTFGKNRDSSSGMLRRFSKVPDFSRDSLTELTIFWLCCMRWAYALYGICSGLAVFILWVSLILSLHTELPVQPIPVSSKGHSTQPPSLPEQMGTAEGEKVSSRKGAALSTKHVSI